MKTISTQTLQRIPLYINYLKALPKNGTCNISATTIAAALNMGEVQVRKDLAVVSNSGKPKVGYNINDLISELESYMGYDDVDDAIIIGAGKLGKALLDYSGFSEYGLNIVAAFDEDEMAVGETESGKAVFHISRFSDLCKRLKVKIGIITVPSEHAQAACDLMTRNGICAIWNFAPVHLTVPQNVLIKNENMASSLALLSKLLKEQLNKTT